MEGDPPRDGRPTMAEMGGHQPQPAKLCRPVTQCSPSYVVCVGKEEDNL